MARSTSSRRRDDGRGEPTKGRRMRASGGVPVTPPMPRSAEPPTAGNLPKPLRSVHRPGGTIPEYPVKPSPRYGPA